MVATSIDRYGVTRPLREKLSLVEMVRLDADLIEEIAREASTTRELHSTLAPRWEDAYYIKLGIYTVQNALDRLVRARAVRFGGWNRDLYCALEGA